MAAAAPTRGRPAPDASTLDRFARAKLARLEADGLRRSLSPTRRGADGIAERGGTRLISFCCNDYLNLSQHPAVKRAAVEAVAAYGAGAGASRLVTGDHPLFETLEARLAKLKDAEACCVFGSGYLANIGVIPSLAGPDDLILLDELCHASMHAGARLSGARIAAFAHNDLDDCRARLRSERSLRRHCLILTEGVFSMDGDRAPLGALRRLAAEQDCWLAVDDAHGLGVVGGGRGSAFAEEPPARIPIQIGTLSKAAGAYGGFVCGSAALIDLIRTRARSLIYSTGLPPAAAAAALAAVDIIERDAALTAAPLANARLFTGRLGLPPAESAIVPVIVGDAQAALAASARLERAGFLVTPIRPPTVPAGTSRLRITFSAGHRRADVERLADCVGRLRADAPGAAAGAA